MAGIVWRGRREVWTPRESCPNGAIRKGLGKIGASWRQVAASTSWDGLRTGASGMSRATGCVGRVRDAPQGHFFALLRAPRVTGLHGVICWGGCVNQCRRFLGCDLACIGGCRRFSAGLEPLSEGFHGQNSLEKVAIPRPVDAEKRWQSHIL